MWGRSLMILLLPLILVQIITVIVFYDRHHDTTTRLLVSNIAGAINATLDHKLESLSTPEIEHYFHVSVKKIPDFSLPDTSKSTKNPLYDSYHRSLQGMISYPYRSNIEDDDFLLEIKKDGVVYQFSMDSRRLYVRTTSLLMIWSLGSSFLFLIIAALFLRNQIRPLTHLAWVADQIGKGRKIEKIHIHGAKEVRKVGWAFHQMSERLQRQVQQRSDFLAGVSHDLRTPLARMELQLALSTDQGLAEELKKDVHDMRTMIEGYLSFARGEGDEGVEPIDVSSILRELEDSFGRMWPESVQLRMTYPEHLDFMGRPTALRRALTNLLDNAGRYGTQIDVQMKEKAKGVEIIIDDNGPGIPLKKRDLALKPFQRLSKEEAGLHVGLGLSIAQDIILAHGGRLQLQNSPLKGLRVRIWMPK